MSTATAGRGLAQRDMRAVSGGGLRNGERTVEALTPSEVVDIVRQGLAVAVAAGSDTGVRDLSRAPFLLRNASTLWTVA